MRKNIFKNGRAMGSDNICAEDVKLKAEENGNGLELLIAVFNDTYRSSIIPKAD